MKSFMDNFTNWNSNFKTMRKSLKILFVLCFISTGIIAQITYQFEDFAISGDSYIINTKLYNPFDSVNISQFDENWDFANLVTNSVYSVRFVNPSELDYSDSFPEANLSMVQEDGTFLFMNSNEIGVQLLGIATDFAEIGIPFAYAVEEEFMMAKFPINNGDEFENSATFSIADTPENLGIDPDSLELPIGVDSIRIVITLSDQSNIDDYGIVTLPYGNFDCLKENRIEIFNVGIEVYFIAIWVPVPELSINDTTHIYRFLAKEYGYPIVEIFAGIDDQVFAVSYIDDIAIKTNNIATNDEIFIYPNPANNFIQVKIPEKRNDYIINITEISGRKIMSSILNYTENEIDISTLKPGSYLISISNSTNNIISSKIFIVADK